MNLNSSLLMAPSRALHKRLGATANHLDGTHCATGTSIDLGAALPLSAFRWSPGTSLAALQQKHQRAQLEPPAFMVSRSSCALSTRSRMSARRPRWTGCVASSTGERRAAAAVALGETRTEGPAAALGMATGEVGNETTTQGVDGK